MNSLFMSFDPTSVFIFSFNWSMGMILLLSLPSSFWFSMSQVQMGLFKGLNLLFLEMRQILGNSAKPGASNISLMLVLSIWMMNVSGLIPYTFTMSSHMSLTLSVALPLWGGPYIWGWMNKFNSMLSHLVPQGSPLSLAPFMVGIELVSALIRPITLSVRLAANMVAGHLLLILISIPITSSSSAQLMLILMILICMAILESAVATIQAYVFGVLTLLYIQEIN